jgi:murein DD-endopeptidase MepM/ murein hydrolase activator NlpD
MQSSYSPETPASLDKPGQIQNTPTNLACLLNWQSFAPQRLFGDTSAANNKLVAHIAMIAIIVLAVAVSNLELSWGTISTVRPIKYSPNESTPPARSQETVETLSLLSELTDTQTDILVRAAVPRTIIPNRTRPQESQAAVAEIRVYTVGSGDTISGIAEKFGLKPETVIWANPELERNPDLLWVGQELTILPVDGVYHQVGSGDTIDGIAAVFKVDSQAIINYPLNQLDPENLIIRPGDWLVVPGGNKPFVPRTVVAYSGPVPADATVGSGIFGWPASGRITQGYFGYHPGLDIGGWVGAPIIAADSGHVIVSGWDNTGYGNMLVIDHGNGFQTLYAHLNAMYVAVGANVSKGEQIAEMGNTGNSTGAHLHFEIRQGTVQRNPYGFLP